MIDYKRILNSNFTTDSPNFIEDEFDLPWSMSRNERFAFINLVRKIKPKVSLEIGTYKGGSLQVLSKFSEKVITCDINAEVETILKPKFDNVNFWIGDSQRMIPKILEQIESKNETLQFILVDGNHTTEAVKKDINLLLKYKPKAPLHIILHDSFNPACRKGMLLSDLKKCEYLHYAEIDYITGSYNHDGLKRQMWGGFAHLVLLPHKRTKELTVSQSQQKLYDTVYLHSIHHLKSRLRFLKPIYRLMPFKL